MLKLLDLLPSWLYAALLAVSLVALGATFVAWSASKTEVATLKLAIVTKDKAIAEDTIKIKAADAAVTTELQKAADTYAKEKEYAKVAADIRYGKLADSLHDRPVRPAPSRSKLPADAPPGASPRVLDGPGLSVPSRSLPERQLTNGAGLYREDALFIAGDARRANELRDRLLSCQKLYADVEAKVNK